ncbi:MAG: hypothetical protein AABN33_08535 [Acidobacteriota bacterium]
MRRIRRTEVTVETDEVTIIRSSQNDVTHRCPYCSEAIVRIIPELPAVELANGQPQKTTNDGQTPASVLIGEKACQLIDPGQTVTLQVRNPDGTLSDEFTFTRPAD